MIRRCTLGLAMTIMFSALATAQTRTVLLDGYFNHETHKNKQGVLERFHYTWEDTAVSGFSKWGDVFRSQGYALKMLEQAPTEKLLKGADVYIIVDPDTRKETPSPNFIGSADIAAISNWVKQGGVLVLMANDSANAELPHLNQLASVFGIRFTDTMVNHVIKDGIASGTIVVKGNNEIFPQGRQLYLKDVSALSLSAAARSLLNKGDTVILASAQYGKGTVFAVGDPWLYNEYITSQRLTPEYQNEPAAAELVTWFSKQIPPASISSREVSKWLKERTWSGGADVNPHESVNKELFYRQYHLNQRVWDSVFLFFKQNDLGQLKPGKYPIDGDHAFATITESENKPVEATKWESHRRYIDMQYIISGKEKIGVANASTAKVIKPYTVDVLNYEADGIFYISEAGKFFLFFPDDAHRPNIRVEGVSTVKKLVIKIEMVY